MNILVTGAWSFKLEEIDAIKSLGHNVVIMSDERGALPCDANEVEGVICNGLFLYHPIEDFASLKYIQLTSAGYDRLPMDYVKKNGITIKNAGGVYSIPMAEYALCGVLQIYKYSRFFLDNQERHAWEKNRNIRELFGKTVIIVGCGSVGNECAKRFKAMGARVIGVDLFVRSDVNYDGIFPINDMADLLVEADVLVLTLPYTDATRHIIGAKAFEKIKKGAVLVNISRGGVLDTTALLSALQSRTLSGAVLDVFEEEPLPANNPLWDMENVIITPHNSFVGEGNGERLFRLICKNLVGE